MPTKFERIVQELYREGKIGVAEVAALTAAVDLLKLVLMEGTDEGGWREIVLKRYGKQIRKGVKDLQI